MHYWLAIVLIFREIVKKNDYLSRIATIELDSMQGSSITPI